MNLFEDTLILKSKVDELSSAELFIDGLLEKGLIPQEIYGNVMVAFTEAILNAIHHGNKNEESKSIMAKAKIDSNRLNISVIDEGDGFDFENIPDPTLPENIEALNGRGIFMIHNLADQVTFESNGAAINLAFNLNVNELVAS